jgi:hypothetical protein
MMAENDTQKLKEYETILSLPRSGVQGDISAVQISSENLSQTVVNHVKESQDVDLAGRALWAMNYLLRTPRPEFNYEPHFECHNLEFPPTLSSHDATVPGDTDCRMDWEFYYMRDICGTDAGLDIEAAFHQRILGYLGDDGLSWVRPGHYMESTPDAQVPQEKVASTWGTAKTLISLSEAYKRGVAVPSSGTTATHDGEKATLDLARKVFLALKGLATWHSGRATFEGGSGGWRDGVWVKKQIPHFATEPVVQYWLATGDNEALDFAIALAEVFLADETIGPGRPSLWINSDGQFSWHMHTTLHAVWGVGHLGQALRESRYIEWARRVYDYARTHGPGTGWVHAGVTFYNCETCATSDLVSLAALLGRSGYPEYFDHVERYLRNYIRTAQFFITPAFESLYRSRHQNDTQAAETGLRELRRFEGGFLGLVGINDQVAWLTEDNREMRMFGCCAPEGMRALHTAWSNAVTETDGRVLVNMAFNRETNAVKVISGLPAEGKLTVEAKHALDVLLRPPSWTPREEVIAQRAQEATEVVWGGPGLAYVQFKRVQPGEQITIAYPLVDFKNSWQPRPDKLDIVVSFHWRGNTVTDVSPKAKYLPIYPVGVERLPSFPEVLRSTK